MGGFQHWVPCAWQHLWLAIEQPWSPLAGPFPALGAVCMTTAYMDTVNSHSQLLYSIFLFFDFCTSRRDCLMLSLPFFTPIFTEDLNSSAKNPDTFRCRPWNTCNSSFHVHYLTNIQHESQSRASMSGTWPTLLALLSFISVA